MADRRARKKGRQGGTGSFLALPHVWLDSPEFRALSARATKALLGLAAQYRGANNGTLALPRGRHQVFGWGRAHGSVDRALKELEASGFVVKTRQGGKNMPSLYAVTWWPVDRCDGRHDHPAGAAPLHLWRHPEKRDACPTVGQVGPEVGQSAPSRRRAAA